MAEKTYHRSQDAVVHGILFPASPFDDWGDGRRNLAALEVLRRLPDDAYARLESTADEFSWFVPDAWMKGMLMPFPVTEGEQEAPGGLALRAQARVLYLSPVLENRALDISVAVIAHELAHLFLGHSLRADPGAYDRQEEEAWQQVDMWGFQREAKKHLAASRRAATQDRQLVERMRR